MEEAVVKSSGGISFYAVDELVWGENNFEPLILAIILSFFSRSPWKLKSTKFVRECEGNLQRMWSYNFLLGEDLLRKLFSVSRSLEIMPRDMVWEVL